MAKTVFRGSCAHFCQFFKTDKSSKMGSANNGFFGEWKKNMNVSSAFLFCTTLQQLVLKKSRNLLVAIITAANESKWAIQLTQLRNRLVVSSFSEAIQHKNKRMKELMTSPVVVTEHVRKRDLLVEFIWLSYSCTALAATWKSFNIFVLF